MTTCGGAGGACATLDSWFTRANRWGMGRWPFFETHKQGSPMCAQSTPLTEPVSFLASVFLALGEEVVVEDSLEVCIRLWLEFDPLGNPSGVSWLAPHFFGGGG